MAEVYAIGESHTSREWASPIPLPLSFLSLPLSFEEAEMAAAGAFTISWKKKKQAKTEDIEHSGEAMMGKQCVGKHSSSKCRQFTKIPQPGNLHVKKSRPRRTPLPTLPQPLCCSLYSRACCAPTCQWSSQTKVA